MYSISLLQIADHCTLKLISQSISQWVTNCTTLSLFFFFNFGFIYLFIYLRLCWVFVSVRGLSPAAASAGHSSSRCAGLSLSRPNCGAQAPDAQAQQLWLTGSAAPRHAGSPQTRARTRILCIGRQILNHCATREAPLSLFKLIIY